MIHAKRGLEVQAHHLEVSDGCASTLVYMASWKMMPTVWRWPERTRLTPWRRLTRYHPFMPCTGR
jgi:hypothetical protein